MLVLTVDNLLIEQTWEAMKVTWRWITERMRLSLYAFSLGP